jgi:hypothetical protein
VLPDRLRLATPARRDPAQRWVPRTAFALGPKFPLVMLIAAYAAMGIETTTLSSNEPQKTTPRLAEVALLEFEAGRVKTAV